jgi:hypothetical protein
MNETNWVMLESVELPFVWQCLLGYGMLMNRAAELTGVSRPVINTMIVNDPIAPNDGQIAPNGPVFNMQEVVL